MTTTNNNLVFSSSSESLPGSKVKVIIRIRPFIENENSGARCVDIENNFIKLRNLKVKMESYRYKFDSCYNSDSTQQSIFLREIQPCLSNIFQGLNTSIFAYGVTGAGKTHTMQGSNDQPGIIPRSIEKLLQLQESSYPQATLFVSYLEIYNEKVYDLLAKDKDTILQDLPIREDQARKIVIPNLSEVPINSMDEFRKTYERGCKNRTTAATSLNSKSSRSHAIVLIKALVTQNKKTLIGKLHLIDLAGSEDNRRTDNKGIRLTESTNINQSLFVLAKVVNALNKGSSRIPYRDSKLTRLLQDSLGGNSHSIVIANIAPGQSFFFDSYHTLNFASKSRLIINTPTVNEEEENKENEVVKNVPFETKKIKTGLLDPFKKPNQIPLKGNVQSLIKQLMSPYLKQVKFLEDTTQKRLEKLEEHLIQQNEEEIYYMLHTPGELWAEGNSLSAMTPHSKTRTTKELIKTAKELEELEDLEGAIEYYKQVLKISEIDKNLLKAEQVQKLQDKVKKLEKILIKQRKNTNISPTSLSSRKLDLDQEDESDQTSSTSSIHSSPDQQYIDLNTNEKDSVGLSSFKKAMSSTSLSKESPEKTCSKQSSKKRSSSFEDECGDQDSSSDYEESPFNKPQTKKSKAEDEVPNPEDSKFNSILLELKQKTVKDLKEEAKEKGLKGYSKLRKEELIQLLINHQEN